MGQFFFGWHRSKSFKMKYLLGFAILCFFMHVQAKEGKFLSMFNIVRFNNYACDAGGNKNGTCYTKDECDQRGGVNEGACARIRRVLYIYRSLWRCVKREQHLL